VVVALEVVKACEDIQQKESSVMKMHIDKLHEVERLPEGSDLQENTYADHSPDKWRPGVSGRALKKVQDRCLEQEKREQGVH